MQTCTAFVLLSLLMATIASANAIPLLVGTHSRSSTPDDGIDPPPALSASELSAAPADIPLAVAPESQTAAAVAAAEIIIAPAATAEAASAPIDAAPAASSQPPIGPVHVELPLEPFAQHPHPPPHRVVSYDQRQEGKYNIRADLENFMIVVIPSSPSSGASLLDLLQRQQKHQQQKSAAAAHKKDGPHKKYHAPGTKHTSETASVGGKRNPALNSRSNLVLLQEAVSAELARRAGAGGAGGVVVQQPQPQQQQQPFIEGRTPYHVDISSAGVLPLEPSSPRTSRANIAPRELGHNSVVLIGRLHHADDDYTPTHHQRRGFAWADVLSKSAERYDALLRGNDDEDLAPEVEDEGADSVDRLAAGETPKSGAADDGWDQLTLLGAGEQCGPDRRRDSYGVCQFVPSY